MKKKIIHLSSFKNLGVLYTAFNSLFKLLNQNFDEIIIVNTDNLKLFKKNEFNQYNPSDKKIPQKVKFLNPKKLKELDEKLNFKN